MRNRGRKKKEYPLEQIKRIVDKYLDETGYNGLLKYSTIYNFALELYENNEIDDKLSEDFWRKEGRQGRQYIDQLNRIYMDSINAPHTDSLLVVDTEIEINNFVEKNKMSKAQLINKLKINESNAKKFIEIHEKNKRLNVELKNKQQIIDEQVIRIDALETAIFSMFANSKVEPLIENFLNTGSTRSKYVDSLFLGLFDDSEEIYEKLIKVYSKKSRGNKEGEGKLQNLIQIYNEGK